MNFTRDQYPDCLRYTHVFGVGGIGTGMLIELDGNHTLARTESRMGQILDARDYCKLHIVEHYIAVLTKSADGGSPCKVVAIGNVGDDEAGSTLLREMVNTGIDTRHVKIEPRERTLFSVSFLYPDKSGGNITISNTAAKKLALPQIESCGAELASSGEHGIALCLPEVPLQAREDFLRIASECGNYRIASFAAAEMRDVCDRNMLSHVDLLALNQEEAAALAHLHCIDGGPADILADCMDIALAANPQMSIIVSAGAEGLDVFSDGKWSHRAAVQAKVISTAGAGDALLAGVIAGIVSGLPIIRDDHTHCNDAIGIGLLVAAFSLTSPHSIHPSFTIEALREFVKDKSSESAIEVTNSARGT